MPLPIHPEQGTIVICDFTGLQAPEITKKRPVVVLSPRLRNRTGLCTVAPLSTTQPRPIEPFHFKLHVDPPLPNPYSSPYHWVKGDLMYTVSLNRLSLPFQGKDNSGKRIYDVRVIDKADLLKIQDCVLHGIGLSKLTKYL